VLQALLTTFVDLLLWIPFIFSMEKSSTETCKILLSSTSKLYEFGMTQGWVNDHWWWDFLGSYFRAAKWQVFFFFNALIHLRKVWLVSRSDAKCHIEYPNKTNSKSIEAFHASLSSSLTVSLFLCFCGALLLALIVFI